MPRYHFLIEFPDHTLDDPDGQNFPDSNAAIEHGHRIVRELREGGDYSPGAVLHVRDEAGQPIHSMPI